MIIAEVQTAVELADELSPQTSGPCPRYTVKPGAPSDGRIFAGQELGKKAQDDKMKPQAALLCIALHDPIENLVEGFAGQNNRKNLVGNCLFETIRRIVEGDIRGKVARRDHDDFPFLRAI